MWCVPTAVGSLIGWSREQVWLDILAERHERGRRLTNIPGRIDEPHGGLHAAEALRVLDRAGFKAIDAWSGTKRLGIGEFMRYVLADEHVTGEPGKWLILQRMHLAHLDRTLTPRWADLGSLIGGLPIAKAWKVERKPVTTFGWHLFDQPEDWRWLDANRARRAQQETTMNRRQDAGADREEEARPLDADPEGQETPRRETRRLPRPRRIGSIV